MGKPSGGAPALSVSVLSVSPIEDDHASLRDIFHEPAWEAYTACRWELHTIDTLAAAQNILRRERVPIVICESDLSPGSWRDMLAHIGQTRCPPLLIVTSRIADDRLWAEALNLGAYDVLAKPFDKDEVVRIISLAWLHWKEHGSWTAAAG